MLLINPPTGGVRKSGNCEVRKKSSSYCTVYTCQSSAVSCWINTYSSSTLCLNNFLFIFFLRLKSFLLLLFFRFWSPFFGWSFLPINLLSPNWLLCSFGILSTSLFSFLSCLPLIYFLILLSFPLSFLYLFSLCLFLNLSPLSPVSRSLEEWYL